MLNEIIPNSKTIKILFLSFPNIFLQNRFYVTPKLHTDLKTELWKLFTNLVADNTLLFGKFQCHLTLRLTNISFLCSLQYLLLGLHMLPELPERLRATLTDTYYKHHKINGQLKLNNSCFLCMEIYKLEK